MIEISRF